MAARRIHYPALVDRGPGVGYSAVFPDFPGCGSAGGTLEETVLGAHDALAERLAPVFADGTELPEPTPLEDLAGRRLPRPVTIVLVPVTLPGKAQRVNITMDEALLEEIDAMADNRSRFLAEAAKAELARRRAG
jgi:predicted RNase H-like HicB family nuclease